MRSETGYSRSRTSLLSVLCSGKTYGHPQKLLLSGSFGLETFNLVSPSSPADIVKRYGQSAVLSLATRSCIMYEGMDRKLRYVMCDSGMSEGTWIAPVDFANSNLNISTVP